MRWYYNGMIPVTVDTTDRGPCVIHGKSFFEASRGAVMNLLQSGMVSSAPEPLRVPVGVVDVVEDIQEPVVEPEPESFVVPDELAQPALELESSTESSDGGVEGDASVVDSQRPDEPTQITSRRGRRKRNSKRESES